MFKDALVDHIRDLCKLSTDRTWATGGRVGPDHVIEAVGGNRYGDVLIRHRQARDRTPPA